MLRKKSYGFIYFLFAARNIEYIRICIIGKKIPVTGSFFFGSFKSYNTKFAFRSTHMSLKLIIEMIHKHIIHQFWNLTIYSAFSSLVASSQFSSLGLVLLSALARSSSLLGVTSAIQTQGKKITNPHLNVAAEKERTNYTPRHQGYDEYGEVVERYSVENLPTTRKTFTGVTHKSDTSETRQCDERSHSSIQHSEGKITKYRDSEIDILGNLEHIDDKAQSSNEPRSHTEGDEIDMLFEGLA